MDQSTGDLNNLISRARELKQLGNSDAEIRAILLRQGAGPQDADAIIVQIHPQIKKSGGGCLPWLAAGLVLAVVAGGVLAALYLFPRAAAEQAAPAATAEPLDLLYRLMLPDAGQVESAPAPTQIAALPPIAESYFSVVWNLNGTPMEKAGQFTSAAPPPELLATHVELSASFAVYGQAEQKLNAMDAVIEVECAGSSSNYCKNLLWEKATLEIERDKARSGLYDRWLRACETWRDYYTQTGKSFPYGESRCKYP